MRKFFLLLLLIVPLLSLAQRPTDLELWTGAKVNFKFNKKLSLDFREQIRFDNNISTYKKSFSELGLKYKVGKSFSIKPQYRLSVRQGSVFRHRISLDGNYKASKKGFPLIFKYRIRFQHRLFDPKTYWRNKLTLKYKLSKLVDPFAAYEVFFRFNGRNEFRVSRFTAGLDWRVSKNFEITSYYRLQDDIFIKSPERQHIIGLMVEYKIRKKKKRTAPSLK